MCGLGGLAMLNCPSVSKDVQVRGINKVNHESYGDEKLGRCRLDGLNGLLRHGSDSTNTPQKANRCLAAKCFETPASVENTTSMQVLSQV